MSFSTTDVRFQSENAFDALQQAAGISMNQKPQSRLHYTCQLDIDQVANNTRQTAIVCTLGNIYFYK